MKRNMPLLLSKKSSMIGSNNVTLRRRLVHILDHRIEYSYRNIFSFSRIELKKINCHHFVCAYTGSPISRWLNILILQLRQAKIII